MQHLATTLIAATEAASATPLTAAAIVSPATETTPSAVPSVTPKPSKAEREAARKAAANAKRAAKSAVKPATAKPAATSKPAAKPAKPDNGEALATARAERMLARDYVADFYAGASCPFKSAHDTFSPLNHANGKAFTQRQAALIAAMLLADTSGNIKHDGTFRRGGFAVKCKRDESGKLRLSKAADAETLTMQPESGCLGNMLGTFVSFVSGPTSGKAQAESILRLSLTDKLTAELQSKLGGKLASAAVKRIAELRKSA